MSKPSSSQKPMVVGGKLKLKGSSGSGSAKRSTVSSSSKTSSSSVTQSNSTQEIDTKSKESSSTVGQHLTASQKRHLERKIEKEKEEAKKLSKTSFRDRVDMFNNKLSQMTEHNDIPRISAAGNG